MALFRFSPRSRRGLASGLRGKLFLSLFFGVFLVMGLVFTVLVAGSFLRAVDVASWEATPCTIVASEAAEKDRPSGEKPYTFTVQYTYTWEGEDYASDVYKRSYGGTSDYAEVQRLAETYRPGAEATCYVDPERPSHAVLRRESLWGGLMVLLPLVFVAVGGGGLYFVWRGKRRRADGTAVPEAISSRATGRRRLSGPRVAVAFFAVFFLIGTVLGYFLFYKKWRRIEAAESWPQVPCVVVSSRVQRHEPSDSDSSPTYSVDILYEYEVDGRTYRSNRYDLVGGSSSGRAAKARIVAQHPPGTKTVCAVNPDDPTDAVLRRGYTAAFYLGLIPVGFALIGLVGLAVMVPRALRGPPAEAPAAAGAATAAARPAVPSAPVTLEARSSAGKKLLGVASFAVFWNGVVSIFVWQVVKGWQSGSPNWMLTLMMVPFVLVGLGAVGAVGYYALALANPRPIVTAGSTSLPLGGTTPLQWALLGRVDRVRRLSLFLEGCEQATYVRGTDRVTDTEPFATIPIAEATSRDEIRAGQALLAVPPDTMHSFEARNNKVLWRLQVHAHVHRWPDVKHSYPVTVLPILAAEEEA
ncbi:MAG: DUF3592 domain-containing protein [Candidatus Brocadiia bacterium]